MKNDNILNKELNSRLKEDFSNLGKGVTIREVKGFTVIENHNPIKPQERQPDPIEPMI